MVLKYLMFVIAGLVSGIFISSQEFQPANAQEKISAISGDALWHLPSFGEQGWFIHASNGKVRACNMNKASVIGERTAPRCSSWE